MKRVTTLHLDAELMDELKAKGLNISEFVNNTLRLLVKDETLRGLDKIKEQIDFLGKQIDELKSLWEKYLVAKASSLSQEPQQIDNSSFVSSQPSISTKPSQTKSKLDAEGWEKLRQIYRIRRQQDIPEECDPGWITSPRFKTILNRMGLSWQEALEKLKKEYEKEEFRI